MWLNFGPSHEDRCEHMAVDFKDRANIFGIEVYGKSDTYGWESKDQCSYKKITLFPGKTKINESIKFFRLLQSSIKLIPGIFFFCNYESSAVLLVAIALRMLRQPVIVMNDSKFDDYTRNIKIELIKYLFYSPYKYAIGASKRSIDYLKFFGFAEKNIFTGYNSLSIKRIQQHALHRLNFYSREFIIIARLVPKKNIKIALDAYKIYCTINSNARRLKIIGDGPMLDELKVYAASIGVNNIIWTGFLHYQDVYKNLSQSLCLILISTEEQFGHVVIEALALGIPCIVSTQVGSREEYIVSGKTGFIVEENNPFGIAYFMNQISHDTNLWDSMSEECIIKSNNGDVKKFCSVVNYIHDAILNK